MRQNVSQMMSFILNHSERCDPLLSPVTAITVTIRGVYNPCLQYPLFKQVVSRVHSKKWLEKNILLGVYNASEMVSKIIRFCFQFFVS